MIVVLDRKNYTIAKLGHRYKAKAGRTSDRADTFRAAASDQLQIWAKKLDLQIVTGKWFRSRCSSI